MVTFILTTYSVTNKDDSVTMQYYHKGCGFVYVFEKHTNSSFLVLSWSFCIELTHAMFLA